MNFTDALARNLFGMLAAVVIGGTFLVAAAGPAVAATAIDASAVAAQKDVNSTQISNIVRGN